MANGFIERTLETLVTAIERAMESEEIAKADGLLQGIDPRVKVVGFTGLIFASVFSRRLSVIATVFTLAVLMAALSRVRLQVLAKRVWLPVLLFTGVIAAPAIFITPGRVIYEAPAGWHITQQGVRSAVFLLARAETAASVALLLVLCTRWTHVLKALRVLRVPVVVVVILGMTHRYIFLLLETAREAFEARRSRTFGVLGGKARRTLAVNTAGVVMDRSFQVADDVYMAMQSRGFDGEVRILSDFVMTRRDYAFLVALLGLAVTAIWWGR
jgi:cobalt ECF transporter T component CbiQ